MNKEVKINFDEFNPCVSRAGIQNNVPWKTHTRKIYDHELIYCCRGKAHAIIEDREYLLNPGSLLLIQPNLPHFFWKDETTPGEQLWVHFDCFYRNDIVNMDKLTGESNYVLFQMSLPSTELIRDKIIFENGFKFPEFIKLDEGKYVEELFKKLIYNFENRNEFWPFECKVYLMRIFVCILRQMDAGGSIFSAKNDDRISNKVVQYILSNYHRKISLENISNIVGMNVDYIGRIFKKETSMTVTDFIRMVRLKKAKELLLNTDFQIDNIADMVGFSDSFYFSKVMKKSDGLSPNQWRKVAKSDMDPTKKEISSIGGNNMYQLKIKGSIKRWDEAIPLGNGIIGSLLWGTGDKFIVSLDRGDIWDLRPAEEILSPEFNYKKLIELVKARNQPEIKRIFDHGYSRAYPTKIPAGRLELNFGDYRVKENLLDLETATAEIKFHNQNGEAVMQSYLHAEKKIGWIRIKSDGAFPAVNIRIPDFGSGEEGKVDKNLRKIHADSLKNLVYPKAESVIDGNIRYTVQKTADGLAYGIFVLRSSFEDIKDIIYYVGCSTEGDLWIQHAKERMLTALKDGYEKTIKSHLNWWKIFWGKSSVSLPDRLFENQWYLTNYLFASCSRKGCPPMPLQGLWTADNGKLPPWKGDFHNDLNTQLCYMHYLKANHLEEGESFVDFLWGLRPAAKDFAKSFFDAEGICLPAVMAIDGKPLGGWPMYSLNLTNQIWLCQIFDNHYRYTGDLWFLQNKAYTYFKETAQCILRWLKPDKSGNLRLPLSSSPEIHDDTMASWLTPNSNFDQAMLIYLFKTLLEYSIILGNEERELWETHLHRLENFWVDETVGLKVSQDEILTESHRHHSQAMSIHPLKLLKYDNPENKNVIDLTVKHIESLGTKFWVGFSFAWFSHFYSIQGNGEGAFYQLKLFWENFISPNGFHLNGDFRKRGISSFHYRPFTLEGNMCAASALQDMLLESDERQIKVFPAIPEHWKKSEVSFSNFLAWDQISVSAKISNGILQYIKLYASHGCHCKIFNNFESQFITLHSENEESNIICDIGDSFALTLKENRQYLMECGNIEKKDDRFC